MSRPPSDDLAVILGRLGPAEIEAIWLGALLTMRIGAEPHVESARRIVAALEEIRARTLHGDISLSPSAKTPGVMRRTVAHRLDIAALRQALAQELKLAIRYADAKGRGTERVVWPLGMEDFGPNGAMLAWCEKRRDFRNFRFDRIADVAIRSERFNAPRNVMLALFEAVTKEDESSYLD